MGVEGLGWGCEHHGYRLYLLFDVRLLSLVGFAEFEWMLCNYLVCVGRVGLSAFGWS